MGWINDFEQQQLLTLYGRLAQHRCNRCKQPIFVDEILVIDPKGGYFPRPPGMPEFLAARPKRTYHRKCDDIKRGRKLRDAYPGVGVVEKGGPRKEKPGKEKKSAKVPKAERLVLKLLTDKPRKQYWTKGKIITLLWKKTKTKRNDLRAAIRSLHSQGLIKKTGLCFTIAKKKK